MCGDGFHDGCDGHACSGRKLREHAVNVIKANKNEEKEKKMQKVWRIVAGSRARACLRDPALNDRGLWLVVLCRGVLLPHFAPARKPTPLIRAGDTQLFNPFAPLFV